MRCLKVNPGLAAIVTAALLAILVVPPAAAGAQGAATDSVARGGTVLGTVIDPLGRPLPDVEVFFTGTPRSTRTDAAGRWRFDDPPAGPRVLSARLLGWVPLMLTLNVAAGATDTVPLVMRRVPNTLTTVQVRAQAERMDIEASLLAERLMQMRAGAGRLFTRDEILRSRATSVADLVRGVPGVDVRIGSKGSLIALSKRAGTGAMQVQGEGCPLQFYLDGRAVDNETIASLNPSQFATVEVHPSTSLFTGMPSFPGRCGAIVVRMFWR